MTAKSPTNLFFLQRRLFNYRG